MTGFIFYMITGALISVYRLHIADVHPNDPWFVKRQQHVKNMSNWPLLVQLIVMIFLSAVAIPVMFADYIVFFLERLQMRRYNKAEVRNDIAKYVRFGIMYGEAVSYSSQNRYSPEEAEQLEEVFKEAEARIVEHGFIPLTLGDFVAFYQDGVNLPQLKIKGKKY